MKKIMKKNVKGFTLVEVIVVLVILAAMAALLVPSLVGYVDKANENTALQEAGGSVKAAQTLVSEYYARERKLPSFEAVGETPATLDYNEAKALAEVKGTISAITIGSTGAAKGKITALTYVIGEITVTYTNTDGLSPLYTPASE